MKLKKISENLRFLMVKMSSETKSPHLASSLSCVDIIATLYHSVLDLNITN